MFLFGHQRISFTEYHRGPFTGTKWIKDDRYLWCVIAVKIVQHQGRTIDLSQVPHQFL